MDITEYGVFTPYVPSDELLAELKVAAADPETGTRGVLFCQDSQGRDFYDIVSKIPVDTGSVLISVNDAGLIVGASFPHDRVVPVKGCRYYHLYGDDVPDRLEDIAGKILDLSAKALTEPPLPQRISLYKTDIYSRMTDDEFSLFISAMEAASARIRYMWNDCQQVEVASPFWPLLQQQLTEAFGEERTAAILSLDP